MSNSSYHLGFSIALALATSQVNAASFALIENSAQSMGNAFSGGGAAAGDASTVFFNPASITQFKKRQAQMVGHLVIPSAEFTVQNATTVGVPVPGTGVSLGNNGGGDAGIVTLIPNFYYTQPLSDTLHFGLSVNVPFGMGTEYSRNWAGRFHAVKSELAALNINPAIAWKVDDKLSLGAGVSIQHIDATLTNAIDFGTILDASNIAGGSDLGTEGDPNLEGFAELEGDDITFGINLGLTYQLNEQTRIGLAWRSDVDYDVSGTADFTVPNAVVVDARNAGVGAGVATFIDTGANADVKLPATASFSIYHEANDKLSLMGDITWTRWSVLPELRFSFDNPLQPESFTTLDYSNTIRVAVGADYKYNSRWTFRGGVAYDESPTPNAERISLRIPDNDRIWGSLGFSYKYNDRTTIDVGYAHLFIDDTDVNKVAVLTDAESRFLGNVQGTFDAVVDIISVQAVYQFD